MGTITPLLLLFGWLAAFASAREITTNAVIISQAPSWLTERRAERVVDRIQSAMEWDIRRIAVKWYTDQPTFQQAHGYDSSVLAFAHKVNNTIHMGPRINTSNFDSIFGHELVHTILYQKYKEAIPKWLEEGLANYIAKQGKVDYRWLATQPETDVKAMAHPFKGSRLGSRYHYMASTALIEMIASKCALSDLLQLSVGTKLEAYLSTYCGITDVNVEFRKWLKRKSQASS